jgi:RHS repeat-associated protein
VVNATTGSVAQKLSYDEWGRVLADTNPGFQPFGFAGGIWAADVGLVRFGARDYSAIEGRWTAKDPVGFAGGSSNLYAYSLEDPLNHLDADGLQALPGAIVGAVSGATGAVITGGWNLGGIGRGAAIGSVIGAASGAAAVRWALRGLPTLGAGLASAAGQMMGNAFAPYCRVAGGEPASLFDGLNYGAIAGAAIGAGYATSFVSKAGWITAISVGAATARPRLAIAVAWGTEGIVDGFITGVAELTGAYGFRIGQAIGD